MNNINKQLFIKKKNSKWAIRPLVPEEVYTNREEHLEYLYNAALDAIGRRTMSTVLLGQRRMGKTEPGRVGFAHRNRPTYWQSFMKGAWCRD